MGQQGRNYKASIKALKGHRPYMEDEFIVAGGSRFVGVFDGHGGAKVSGYLRANLYQQYLQAISQCPDPKSPSKEDVAAALVKAFSKVDGDVQSTRQWTYQGSTAVVCVLHTDAKTGVDTIVSANIGDSRAILSRSKRAVDLTSDHKPNSPAESARIKALGGKVTWFGFTDKKGRPIEGSGVYRINGNLAVARAVGDRSERPFVTAEPEIRELLSEGSNDEFIVLASDGVWDVMSSKDTVDFVNNMMSSTVGSLLEGGGAGGNGHGATSRSTDVKISDWAMHQKDDRGIIREALTKRKKRMSQYIADEALRRGSSDNICVVCVWLNES